MACGSFKYNNIVFNNKKELIDYMKTGEIPNSDIVLQEVKNDMLKEALSSGDVNYFVEEVIDGADLSVKERQLIEDTFGENKVDAYTSYVNEKNIPSGNKNTIQPIFQKISTYAKDLVSSVDTNNNTEGNKPIEIGQEIVSFTNKLQENDSTRFIPTESRPESGSNEGLLSMEKEKWYSPRAENKERANTEAIAVQNTEEAAGTRQDVATAITGNTGGQQNRGYNIESQSNTAKHSGGYQGSPSRIQLESGQFVSYDRDAREWTNIVAEQPNGKYGRVRSASNRERDAAAAARDSRIITQESDAEIASNLIFGTENPLTNLVELQKAGYIELNPTDLFYKLKDQFDAQNIGIDEISAAIGTNMYPNILENPQSRMEYPSNLDNPIEFFTNIGFAPVQVEFLTFVYGLMPDAFNKTQKAIDIAMDIMYPKQTGFSVMDAMPYTKEEMYDIMSTYSNKEIEGFLGYIFIHEYMNNKVSFGMERNKKLIDEILERARLLNIDLPLQYENYFQATTKFKSIFKKGQQLIVGNTVVSVHDVDYTYPEDIKYFLHYPDKDSYHVVDMLKMDNFTELSLESNLDPSLRIAIDNARNALSEIGTEIVMMPELRQAGMYNIFENVAVINSKVATPQIIYHEAAHAAFMKGIRINKDSIIKLHQTIYDVLSVGTNEERAMAERLNVFIEQYKENDAAKSKMPLDELKAHEFVTQLVAILAENETRISPATEKSLIDKIIDFFKQIFNYRGNLDLNNKNDVISFINGIANKIRTGEAINFEDYSSMSSDQNINEGTFYYKDFTGEEEKKFLPGKKVTLVIDNKTNQSINTKVGLVGKNNNGDGFIDLVFPDGKTKRFYTKDLLVLDMMGLHVYIKPTGQQQANTTIKTNLLTNEDRETIRDFAVEVNENGYEYTKTEMYEILKDTLNMEFNIFNDLVDTYRAKYEEDLRRSQEPISDKIYEDFKNDNTVPKAILELIADKYMSDSALSERESEIFNEKQNEIEVIIDDKLRDLKEDPSVFSDDESIQEEEEEKGPTKNRATRPPDELRKIMLELKNMDVTPEVAEILKTGVVPNHLLIQFKSGETIEDKTGEAPENSQLAVIYSLQEAADKGADILRRLKDYFGDNAFNQILDLTMTGEAGITGTQLMYVSISRDLALMLEQDPSSLPLVRAMRKKLNRIAQAYSRNISTALNYARLANLNPNTPLSSSDIANSTILSPETVEAKESLLDVLMQEESEEAYLDYAQKRANRSKTSQEERLESVKEKKTTGDKRSKSSKSKWKPKGGGFISSAVDRVRNFIKNNC